MKGRSTWILLTLLAVAAAVWLSTRLGGDERRISRRLDQLEEVIAKNQGESALAAADKARRAGAFLSRSFSLHLEPYAGTITDRAQMSRVMLAYRADSERIGVAFGDRRLELDATRRRASMTTLATVTAWRGLSPSRERYRLALDWILEDGEWVIERVELLEVLEGPAGLL